MYRLGMGGKKRQKQETDSKKMGKYDGFYLKTPNRRTYGQILWWRFPFFPASKYVLL